MCVHMYVSVYICNELYSRGGRISCVATFLTSFLRACSIRMQAGSGADTSGRGKAVPDSVSTAYTQAVH